MDARGWVLKAIETLRFASEQDVARWLEDEGESFSRHELRRTLELLLSEGVLELKNDLFRLKRKNSNQQAFDKLFKD
jgi:Fe2+ or Zn2+ uptake regulation protein